MTLTKTKPRNQRLSPNQRKRLGQHHNQHSHHYAKTYWPYLPVFAVLLLGLIFNGIIAQHNHGVLGYATGISPTQLLSDTNSDRITYHEPALQLNKDLTKAAQAKADDMIHRGYWNHVTPDGKQPWSFITATGYQYEAAGENLAYGFGTSDQVITAWMNSPEHRQNVLDADYQDIGFGIANSVNFQGNGPTTVVVAMYGMPVGMIGKATNDYSSKPVPLGTATQNVSRLQLIDPTHWAAVAIAALIGSAITVFYLRHAWAWRRVLMRSEQFVITHPLLDVLLMGLVVFGLLLSQVAGTIL